MGADDSGNTPRPLKHPKESPGTKLTGVFMSAKTCQDAAVNRTPPQLRISSQLLCRPAHILISTQTEERSSTPQNIWCSYLRIEGHVKVKLLLFVKWRYQVEENGHLHTPANLALDKNTGTHWIGDRFNPRANLDVLNSVSNTQNILEWVDVSECFGMEEEEVVAWFRELSWQYLDIYREIGNRQPGLQVSPDIPIR